MTQTPDFEARDRAGQDLYDRKRPDAPKTWYELDEATRDEWRRMAEPTEPTEPPHLWEIKHPYYGAEAYGDGYITEFETLDELIEHTNSYDADLNFVYRWDWYVPTAADIELYAEDGQELPGETLTLFVVLQRKSRFANWVAPVDTDDEAKVREFLASDRILGVLRKTWAPLLDVTA